jgi:murein DD-endopeptidase MepM/ murein hydrolase activator NlpD
MKQKTTENIFTIARIVLVAGAALGGIFFISHQSTALASTQSVAAKNIQIPLSMKGNFMQSGAIIGKTAPFATISFGEPGKDPVIFNADRDGYFVLGLDRDAAATAELKITVQDKTLTKNLEIWKRTYKVTEVNGLPPSKVNPPESAQAKIAADKVIKTNAWSSVDPYERGFLETFRWPIDKIRITSPWGAVRKLNGSLQTPHYGVDVGAPTGTPIYAPASGIVVIAEPDLFYEGGLVGIDHGQGLISYSMHMSKVGVTAGQRIKQGDKVGEVGSTGRSNGPHLHWSLKWHGRQLDPALMVHPLQEYQGK